MSIKKILNQTTHRPWDIPNSSWKFYQEWNEVIFLHWKVEFENLQEFIPKELEIDLFNGKPWVSLVAFSMNNIRPKSLPSFPPISNFDEINIRTYVKFKNKPGVYFLSIEGSNVISCEVSKQISGLPYRYSKIKRDTSKYDAVNKEFSDTLSLKFQCGATLNRKSELDLWLTERYALFQDSKSSISEFEIHHLEWPIQQISFQEMDVCYPRFHKLLSNNPNEIHYSKGVKVIAWGKIKHNETNPAI